MALVGVAPFGLWQAEMAMTANGVYSSLLLDAASEKAAFVFLNPKAKTIDRVCFRTATVTVGETVDVRLESVSATTGDPSGSLAAANTNAAQVIALTDDDIWFEVTLTEGYAAAAGEALAVVVAMPGVTVGSLNIARLASLPMVHPFVDLFTSSWAKTAASPVGAIRYSDGTYANIPGVLPFATVASRSYASNSTPDERGNKITLPFACKVAGAWHRGGANASGNFTWKLYDNSDVLLASKDIDGDLFNNAPQLAWDFFDTEVTLAANAVVRLTRLPTTTTTTNLAEATNPSGLAAASPGGGTMVMTTRTDAGAWTDTANAMSSIGLIVSALDDGAGAGKGGGIRVLGSAVARSVI